jgi:hypothetical protein
MEFRIKGLPVQEFAPLFGLSDSELAERGVVRRIANRKPGFPDRVELRDAEPGEAVLLLNYMHQPADSPYRASHAVFVLEGASASFDAIGVVPEVLRRRMLSVRAFDGAGMMRDADLVDGSQVESLIERLLADPQTGYLHVHYAKPGCYAARVERVSGI